MAKLKYEIYNKGIEMEQQLHNQLDNYESAIIGGVDEKLASLKNEYEELKIKANVITIDTDMNEYLKSQERFKKLPSIIVDVERERLKLIENKNEFKDRLCKGIAAEIGGEYKAEFNENMQQLAKEYDKHMAKLIELNSQMDKLEIDYRSALYSTIHTKGVYMSMDKAPHIYKVHSEHNIILNLTNAR